MLKPEESENCEVHRESEKSIKPQELAGEIDKNIE